MKVYIITSGEYSDYNIEAVCETSEAARRKCLLLMRQHSYYPYNIEEWDTETGYCDSKVWKKWHVWWDGAKLQCEDGDASIFMIHASSLNDLQRHRDFEFNIDGLRADDEAHALKIASELLAEYKAMIEGV